MNIGKNSFACKDQFQNKIVDLNRDGNVYDLFLGMFVCFDVYCCRKARERERMRNFKHLQNKKTVN